MTQYEAILLTTRNSRYKNYTKVLLAYRKLPEMQGLFKLRALANDSTSLYQEVAAKVLTDIGKQNELSI